MRNLVETWIAVSFAGIAMMAGVSAADRPAIRSFDTGYTIILVRTGRLPGRSVIVGASYEGTILALDYDGKMLWDKPNPLTGYMVRDLWCGDVDHDGNDEVLAALSDGSVHCLNLSDGRPRWAKPFQPNEVPMNAVCTIRSGPASSYVACGGFDKNIYYLDKDGKLLKTIPSSTYSDLHPWGRDREHLGRPVGNAHVANFMRPVPQPDGTDHLLLLGMHNHMQVSGKLYEFKPLAAKPFRSRKIPYTRSIGYLSVIGKDRVLLGSSTLSGQRGMEVNLETGDSRVHVLKNIGPNGYRVTQTEIIPSGNSYQYFFMSGSTIVLLPADFDEKRKETISGPYSFNDLWRDRTNDCILLGSAQSGGSAIHILDTSHPDWKSAFGKLDPPGKIQAMKANFRAARSQLRGFKRPAWERSPDPVLITAADPSHPIAAEIIKSGYRSPVFLSTKRNCRWNNSEKRDWRDQPGIGIENEKYRKRRDKRRNFVQTQQEAVDSFKPGFEVPGEQGISIWAGHGNDPYYYQPSTYRKIIDAAKGKYTVMVWPEVGGHDPDFKYVLDHLFYPLAEYCQPRNGRIVFRSKNIFFQSSVYLPQWGRFLSGEFKDVFISSMEETTDKTQDMSLAGRIGLWASGVTNIWGMRCSRDNPCYDRTRQHAYQRIANHFLRTTVYSLAYGARYTQNTYTDPETMSLVWELIAKGALFIPRREEIVSFSPVHLSITDPDERYIQEGTNNKWTVFYDAEDEAANPMVFSRMNGTWMAAKPTPWDYSTIAFGAKERRQTFIPTFDKGMVLITPVQNGIHAVPSKYRKKLVEYLHPLYRDIMKEYITNGRDYIDSDSNRTYPANSDYYKQVAAEIENRSKLLPLTVSGGVGWVCAQTAPKHLRLTLVDSGYLNPQARTATVSFHTVRPRKMVDLLDGKVFPVTDARSIRVDVPLGLFRFIDIELDEPFPR